MALIRRAAVATCWLLAVAPLPAQTTPLQIAGYRASFTCSAVFLGGRNPLDVFREELDGLTAANAGEAGLPAVDYQRRVVTVDYAGGAQSRLAAALGRFGCVLTAPGSTLADLERLPHHHAPMPAAPRFDDVAWPRGDRVDEAPLPAGTDPAALERAVTDAFDAERYRPHWTLAVLVVDRGRIVAERYAPGWSKDTPYRTWSTAKSITSALLGILARRGQLDPRAPAPIAEWQGANDPRRRITIEDLLHMSSGLASTGSNTPEAYWGGIDTATAAAARALEAAPGTRFRYANYDTLLLVRILRDTIGDPSAALTFPHRELFDRLGMTRTFAETDPYGNFILSSQVYTTPRDLARFALLYLGEGTFAGERILSPEWVAYSQQPGPASARTEPRGWGYAKQFWLLGNDSRVPRDTYTTAGSRGQLATIVPSAGLIVVRTGLDPPTGSGWDQAALVAEVLRALRPAGAAPSGAGARP